jgi:hypothetical protein
MPAAVRRLAGPGVLALGQVAELAEVFDRVRLTVAPLRYGAGVKGKVLDSLAAGVPCVMSRSRRRRSGCRKACGHWWARTRPRSRR